MIYHEMRYSVVTIFMGGRNHKKKPHKFIYTSNCNRNVAAMVNDLQLIRSAAIVSNTYPMTNELKLLLTT